MDRSANSKSHDDFLFLESLSHFLPHLWSRNV